jgi:hypothetical protein
MLVAGVSMFFCVLTTLLRQPLRYGFLGSFLRAIVALPLVVLPLLLITGPAHCVEWRRHASSI